MIELSVEAITKRFTLKGTPAVFETTFAAAPGGITTLLGPSGSGKTTVLRVIAGLESADEGFVKLAGADITQVPARERGFGFVFQTFALFPNMTVRQNIGFGLKVRKANPKQAAERVDELLTLVKLTDYGHRYPAQLSGGQRQRVGFARALAPYPKILLLDEPFGALDAQVRLELRDFLLELHEITHLTTLLVTHDQEEALQLSDRIVVLDRGRVHQVGTPREIYDAPTTPFVASFVGMANVLNGRVRGGHAYGDGIDMKAPSGLRDGDAIKTMVRPHDIQLKREGEGAPVRIARVTFAGPFVKLDVVAPEGGRLSVQLRREEHDRLALVAGDEVRLDVLRASVFHDTGRTFEPPLG